jgi:polyketide cyclase/dehydrase/lipid transport protein
LNLDAKRSARLYRGLKRKFCAMPKFQISEQVFIDRSPDRVRAFLSDINSLVLWDRSVSKVISESPNPLAVGSKFATIGPFRRGRVGTRTEYQVVAVGGDEGRVALVNSPNFKSAVWTLRFATQDIGTIVQCQMDLSTDLLHAPIGLLLRLNRKAIASDLQFLKRAIENGEVAKR